MAKIIITTSRRTTPTVRSFVKSLLMILPNSLRISRGKLSLDMLALQALDLESDKVLMVRSRKGNPGYLDVYIVDVNNTVPKLIKFCTLNICGYSVIKTKNRMKNYSQSFSPTNIIVYLNILNRIDNDALVECLSMGFNAKVCNNEKDAMSAYGANTLTMDIKKIARNSKDLHYEIVFKDISGLIRGPVIRVCSSKIYIKF